MANKEDSSKLKRKKGESFEDYMDRTDFIKRKKGESDEDYLKRLDERAKKARKDSLKPGEFKMKDGRRFEQHIKSGGSVKKNYAYGGRVARYKK